MTATPPGEDALRAMREAQRALAAQVVARDDFRSPLRLVAGARVRDDGGQQVEAAVALMDARTLEVVDRQLVRAEATVPRVAGLRGFRQLPALLLAFERLSAAPDLVLVDGPGIAHPQRLGLAAHFGVASGLPSIGVTTEPETGASTMTLHAMRGAFVPLRERRDQLGWVLRSQVEAAPLFISPGHRVAMASAADLVMRFVREDRLPEPLRLAAAGQDGAGAR